MPAFFINKFIAILFICPLVKIQWLLTQNRISLLDITKQQLTHK